MHVSMCKCDREVDREIAESGFAGEILELLGGMPSDKRAKIQQIFQQLSDLAPANLPQGTVPPWHILPDNEAYASSSGPCCLTCGKTEAQVQAAGSALMSCARCKTVKYCSKECQKGDWKRHKRACDLEFESNHCSAVKKGEPDIIITKKISTLGSGPHPPPPTTDVLICAQPGCGKPGTLACISCKSVAYCSKGCQDEHKQGHKATCNHPMASPNWKVNFKKGEKIEGEKKGICPIWSNTFAASIVPKGIALKTPEDSLSICFAASLDLNNVIYTVANLPEDSKGKLTVYVNDLESSVTARNFLQLAMLLKHGDAAVDAVIHSWYSAAVTPETSAYIKAMMNGVMKDFPEGKYSQVTYKSTKGNSTLTGDFDWELHNVLDILIETSEQLPYQFAMAVRKDVESEARAECLFAMNEPRHRACLAKFLETGVLLPTDCPQIEKATAINPSGFWAEGKWVPLLYCSPASSWPIQEILAAGKAHRVPENDVIGATFFYLQDTLKKFVKRTESMAIEFYLSHDPAEVLAEKLTKKGNIKFDYIHLNNLADPEPPYVGIVNALKQWAPLLNSAANPNSTIFTALMNWAGEVMPGEKKIFPTHPPVDMLTVFQDILPKLVIEDHEMGFTTATSPAQQFARTAAAESKCHEHMSRQTGIPADNFKIPGLDYSREAIETAGISYLFSHRIPRHINLAPRVKAYMKWKGADAVAAKLGIQRRKVNKIIPFRHGTPRVDSPHSTLSFVHIKNKREKFLQEYFCAGNFADVVIEWCPVARRVVENEADGWVIKAFAEA